MHLLERAEELLRRVTRCLSLCHLRQGRPRRRPGAARRAEPTPDVALGLPKWPPCSLSGRASSGGSADFLGGLLTRTRSAYVVVAGSQAFGLLAIAVWSLS